MSNTNTIEKVKGFRAKRAVHRRRRLHLLHQRKRAFRCGYAWRVQHITDPRKNSDERPDDELLLRKCCVTERAVNHAVLIGDRC